MKGFRIHNVVITSDVLKPALVNFEPGVNVITGPSDTGKSYLLELIAFLLGRKDPPHSIPEARSYKAGFLTIKDTAGSLYTLKRALDGGEFELFDGAFDIAMHEKSGKPLSAKHGKAGKSYSEFLLGICGGTGKQVAKNASGVARDISFADIRHLMLVDEQAILKRESPILSGQYVSKTAEANIFRYLVTNRDQSNLPSKRAVLSPRREIDAAEDFYKLMAAEAAHDFGELTESSDELKSRSQKLTNRMNEIDAELVDVGDTRRTFYEKKNSIEKYIRKARSRLQVIEALEQRFNLLKQRYEVDIKRLETIVNASYVLSLGGAGQCPICGQDMSKAPHKHAAENHLALTKAYEIETRQILEFIDDIKKSIDDLIAEKNEITTKIRAREKDIAAIEADIKSRHDGIIRNLVIEKDKLVDELLNVERRLVAQKQLNWARELYSRTEIAVTEDVEKVESGAFADEVDEFTRIAEAILREWSFPSLGRVIYSERRQDLVISGRDRGSYGKGFRAISYSAFLISLMKICEKMQTPHPGIVILDSPLVTYRKPDVEEGEAITDDMAEAFYRSLPSVAGNDQIIVLENEEPPSDLITKVNYIHFSKREDKGRYGLFPIVLATTRLGL